MTLTAKDFIKLRWSLPFLLLAALLAVAMTTTSKTLVENAQAQQQQLRSQQRDIRNRLNRAPEEEQELRKKIALFNQLQNRGIIGQEERLNWVEQISRIKKARRLLDFQYEIAPQRVLDNAEISGDAGEYEFMASAMNLQMPLLHENDLLGFLSDLRRSVHADLLVRNCSIDRLPPGGDRGTAAQLRASCNIDWITLREKRQ